MRLSDLFDKFADRKPKRLRSSLFFVIVFIYVAFHMISGERGLLAYVQLKGEIEEKKNEMAMVETEKNQLGVRVMGMRANSLNLDLLEEVARRDLGYSRQDEMIYFLD